MLVRIELKVKGHIVRTHLPERLIWGGYICCILIVLLTQLDKVAELIRLLR